LQRQILPAVVDQVLQLGAERVEVPLLLGDDVLKPRGFGRSGGEE